MPSFKAREAHQRYNNWLGIFHAWLPCVPKTELFHALRAMIEFSLTVTVSCKNPKRKGLAEFVQNVDLCVHLF